MPTYISKEGTWYPAKEKVSLVDHKGVDGRQPGEPYIYEGPDRGALFELWKAGVDKFGMDFRFDSDFINRVRQLGFKNVDEYLKFVGYDEKKAQESADKKATIVTHHEIEKKVKAIKELGGGQDTSGQGRDAYGGFGKAPDVK